MGGSIYLKLYLYSKDRYNLEEEMKCLHFEP